MLQYAHIFFHFMCGQGLSLNNFSSTLPRYMIRLICVNIRNETLKIFCPIVSLWVCQQVSKSVCPWFNSKLGSFWLGLCQDLQDFWKPEFFKEQQINKWNEKLFFPKFWAKSLFHYLNLWDSPGISSNFGLKACFINSVFEIDQGFRQILG